MITALEIEKDKVYLCRLKEGRKARVLWSQEILREGNLREDEKALGYFLKEIFESEGLVKDKVVLLLPPESYYIRYLEVPTLRSNQLKKALKFQAESLIPSITSEDVILDYEIIEKKTKTMQLLIAVVKKNVMKQHIQVLDFIGVEPDRILPETLSLWEAYRRAGWTNGKSQLFVNVEASSGSLLMVRQGKPAYCRNFLFRNQRGLEREFKRSLLWMPGLDRLDQIFLIGMEQEEADKIEVSELLGKKEVLSSAQVFDPDHQGNVRDSVKNLALIGGGLSLSRGSLLLDLRQEEFQSLGAILKNRWLIVLLLAWINLALFFSLISTYRHMGVKEQDFQKIVTFEQKWWKKIFPRRKTFPRQMFLKIIERRITELSKKGGYSFDGRMGFIEALKVLEKHLKNKTPLRFRGIALEKGSLNLTGDSDHKDAFLSLKNALQQKEGLSLKWDLTQIKRANKTSYRFILRMQLEASK